MVATLIILLVIVIFLAFFVGKNLGNLCTFWLFKTFENLPVAVLVLIAFGAGIVCSILFVIAAKIRSASTADLNAQIEDQKEKLAKKSAKIMKQNEKSNEKLEKIKKKELKKRKQNDEPENAHSVSEINADNKQ